MDPVLGIFIMRRHIRELFRSCGGKKFPKVCRSVSRTETTDTAVRVSICQRRRCHSYHSFRFERRRSRLSNDRGLDADAGSQLISIERPPTSLTMRALLALILALHLSQGFYLPGLAPVTYCDTDKDEKCTSEIRLYVNRLNSESSVLPFEYKE